MAKRDSAKVACNNVHRRPNAAIQTRAAKKASAVLYKREQETGDVWYISKTWGKVKVGDAVEMAGTNIHGDIRVRFLTGARAGEDALIKAMLFANFCEKEKGETAYRNSIQAETLLRKRTLDEINGNNVKSEEQLFNDKEAKLKAEIEAEGDREKRAGKEAVLEQLYVKYKGEAPNMKGAKLRAESEKTRAEPEKIRAEPEFQTNREKVGKDNMVNLLPSELKAKTRQYGSKRAELKTQGTKQIANLASSSHIAVDVKERNVRSRPEYELVFRRQFVNQVENAMAEIEHKRQVVSRIDTRNWQEENDIEDSAA